MRILQVHKYYHNRDGAGRYVFGVMQLLEKAGHTVAIFAMHDPRNSPSVWDKYFVSALDTTKVGKGLALFRQFARAAWSREAKQKMIDIVDAFRPEVVHLHNIYTHLSPSVLSVCRARGIPVVITVHDHALLSANYTMLDGQKSMSVEDLGLWNVAKTRYIKGSLVATLGLEIIFRIHKWLRLYDRAIDIYLPVSKYLANMLTAVGYPKAKIKVLPLFAANFLDQEALAQTDVSKREGVLFAGRLEDYKGYEFVVQAAKHFPDTQFYIAGTGPGEAQVQYATREYANLHYLGFLQSSELWKKMRHASLVVIPSYAAESFPLIAFEAMASGTPVLGSDIGGMPEHIKPGFNGYLFKVGNQQDFLAQLKVALAEPKTLKTLGKNALQYALAEATPEKHLDRLLEVYNQVLIHKK